MWIQNPYGFYYGFYIISSYVLENLNIPYSIALVEKEPFDLIFDHMMD